MFFSNKVRALVLIKDYMHAQLENSSENQSVVWTKRKSVQKYRELTFTPSLSNLLLSSPSNIIILKFRFHYSGTVRQDDHNYY